MFRGRGNLNKDKKMYGPDGTGRHVPFTQWKREVLNNPKGETAQRAKRENDPDLGKLNIPIIGIVHGPDPRNVTVAKDPGNFATESRSGPVVVATISPEKAKAMGFRKAEEGKGGRQSGE